MVTNSLSKKAGAIAVVLAFFCASAMAQEQRTNDPEDLLHYAYSTLTGSGWYKVGDRKVAILEAPFSWTLRDTQDYSRVGLNLLLPIAFGFNNFSSDDPIPESDDVSTVSFVPGLEVEIPLPHDWLLRPYGQFGFGSDIDSSENAWIYAGGIKARHQFAELRADQAGITMGVKGIISGYSPENGNDDNIGMIAFGFDVQLPQSWRFADRLTYLGLSVYGNYYLTEANFENFVEDSDDVRSEVTVALALGGKPDFELLGMTFDRIGLGYKRGDGIRAITLVTEFPF